MQETVTSSSTTLKIVAMTLQINPSSQRDSFIGGFSGNGIRGNRRSVVASPAASTASSSSSLSHVDSAIGASSTSPLSSSPSPSHVTKTQQQQQQLQSGSNNCCLTSPVKLQVAYTIIENNFSTIQKEKTFITNTIDISIENVATELINVVFFIIYLTIYNLMMINLKTLNINRSLNLIDGVNLHATLYQIR